MTEGEWCEFSLLSFSFSEYQMVEDSDMNQSYGAIFQYPDQDVETGDQTLKIDYPMSHCDYVYCTI